MHFFQHYFNEVEHPFWPQKITHYLINIQIILIYLFTFQKAIMDPQQQFCLKWNSYSSNLALTFSNLFKSEILADVTLFCGGKLKIFFIILLFDQCLDTVLCFYQKCSVSTSTNPFFHLVINFNVRIRSSTWLSEVMRLCIHLICVQLIKSTPRCER